MDVIITTIFGFIGGTSIIAGLILRRFDKLEKKLDRRESDRVRESVMQSELIGACGSLCEANTISIQALSSTDACTPELDEFRRTRAAMSSFMLTKSAEYLHSR